MSGSKTLVTGGVRSGKSHHAESLLPAGRVTYVAPGPTADAERDPDWADRIKAHRARRPRSWATMETADLPSAIDAARGAVLVDCLGTWVTALVTEADLWSLPYTEISATLEDQFEAAVAAVAASDHQIVLVTNEVGLGVVPAHPSGRIFRDLVGVLNQRFADVCDEVHLVVAGRVLVL